MAGTTTSLSTVDQFVQEVWAKTLNDAYRNNLVLEPLMDHRFEAEFEGVPTDKIYVNGFSEFDAATGSIAATGITESARLTYDEGNYESQASIEIDRHYYKAFALERTAEFFVNVPQMDKLKEQASFAMAKELDTFLAGFFDTEPGNSVGALLTPTSDEDIIKAQRLLNDANVPINDRFYVFSSIQEAEFKKENKYINSDFSQTTFNVNAGNGLVASGLYNSDWYMSTNIEGSNAAGHDNAMFQREYLALVSKDKMRAEGPFYDIDTDTSKFVIHNYYGEKVLRSNNAVALPGL